MEINGAYACIGWGYYITKFEFYYLSKEEQQKIKESIFCHKLDHRKSDDESDYFFGLTNVRVNPGMGRKYNPSDDCCPMSFEGLSAMYRELETICPKLKEKLQVNDYFLLEVY